MATSKNTGQHLAQASWVMFVSAIAARIFLASNAKALASFGVVALVFYSVGFVLGVVALASMRRFGRRGILLPALIGVALNLCVLAAFAFLVLGGTSARSVAAITCGAGADGSEVSSLDEDLPIFVYARGHGREPAIVAAAAVGAVRQRLVESAGTLSVDPGDVADDKNPVGDLLAATVRETSAALFDRFGGESGAEITVVVAAARHKVFVAHVGAGRTALVRGARAAAMTDPHTALFDVQHGAARAPGATDSELRATVTRLVGLRRDVDVDLAATTLGTGAAAVFLNPAGARPLEEDEVAAAGAAQKLPVLLRRGRVAAGTALAEPTGAISFVLRDDVVGDVDAAAPAGCTMRMFPSH